MGGLVVELWGSSGEFPQVLKEFHGLLSNPVIPIFTRPRRRRGRMEAGTTGYNLQWTVKLYEVLWNLPEGVPRSPTKHPSTINPSR
jgi:hypothetical protein